LEPPPDSFYVENGPGLLIDDFERGVRDNLLFGFWYHFSDITDSGLSRITNLDDLDQMGFARGDSAFYSRRSLEVSYVLNMGDYNFDPFVGFGTRLPTNVGDTAFNGSIYQALTYWHRGDAHWVRLETGAVFDQDWHQYRVSSSDQWQRVIIPLADFDQQGWGEPVPLDLLNLQAISWQIRGVRGAHGRQGTLRIDNVYLALPSEELTP
jgi:endoglucanase